MPAIHLPALQGIAGLRPINVTAVQNVSANTTYTFTIYTVGADKILLLTRAYYLHTTGQAPQVQIYAVLPTLSEWLQVMYNNLVDQLKIFDWNGLIFLPPSTVIKTYFYAGSSSGLLLYGISGVLFDYFGEE